jgi:Domain of unknown function (DUF4277)
MLSSKEIDIQNIDHLGIVAGIIDAIGLVEIINELKGNLNGERGTETAYGGGFKPPPTQTSNWCGVSPMIKIYRETVNSSFLTVDC